MNKAPSRITAEILEMADDMHGIGVMDTNAHQQITVGYLGREPLLTPRPSVPGESEEPGSTGT